jgi:hypothetical protein
MPIFYFANVSTQKHWQIYQQNISDTDCSL